MLMTAPERSSENHDRGGHNPVVDEAVTALASRLVDAKLNVGDSDLPATNMFDPKHTIDLADLELDDDIAQLVDENRSRKVSNGTF
jgi:hypothetical protein